MLLSIPSSPIPSQSQPFDSVSCPRVKDRPWYCQRQRYLSNLKDKYVKIELMSCTFQVNSSPSPALPHPPPPPPLPYSSRSGSAPVHIYAIEQTADRIKLFGRVRVVANLRGLSHVKSLIFMIPRPTGTNMVTVYSNNISKLNDRDLFLLFKA